MSATPQPFSELEIYTLLHIVPKWVSGCGDIVHPANLSERLFCQKRRHILSLCSRSGGADQPPIVDIYEYTCLPTPQLSVTPLWLLSKPR